MVRMGKLEARVDQNEEKRKTPDEDFSDHEDNSIQVREI